MAGFVTVNNLKYLLLIRLAKHPPGETVPQGG